MKNGNADKCHGCGRHCPLSAPRCKYGVRYAAKQKEKDAGGERRFKWEKYVVRGGLTWQMLRVSRSAKKALVRGTMTEEKLLSQLSDEERQMLGAILQKLDVCEDID